MRGESEEPPEDPEEPTEEPTEEPPEEHSCESLDVSAEESREEQSCESLDESAEEPLASTVSAFLRQGDIFEELESSSARLAWLCSPAAALEIARLLTQAAPEDASQEEALERGRAAFVAAELLTRTGFVAEQLCEAFVDDGAEAFHCLWDFAERSAPREVNSVLSSHFARVAVALFGRDPAGTAGCLRSRGGDGLLQWLLTFVVLLLLLLLLLLRVCLLLVIVFILLLVYVLSSSLLLSFLLCVITKLCCLCILRPIFKLRISKFGV